MTRAPESGTAGSSLPVQVPCPFCASTDTRLLSPFGGQLTVAQYWCNGCRTGFEYIKWEAPEDDDYADL
jgi:hypothetical protein